MHKNTGQPIECTFLLNLGIPVLPYREREFEIYILTVAVNFLHVIN